MAASPAEVAQQANAVSALSMVRAAPSLTEGAYIVHDLPGRLRLRLPALAHAGPSAAQLQAWMEADPAVLHVRINRAARALVVEYDPDSASREATLERLGRFRLDADLREQPLEEEAEILPLVCGVAALLLVPFLPPAGKRILTLLTVGPTLARGVDAFVQSGIGTEALDALAVGLSAVRGEYYTASLTASMLALGEYMETRTARQSDRMLRRLLRPRPVMAWVEREGALEQIAGDQIQVGDIVVVGPGETVPADGRVVSGTALVNQSAITGEDVPVRREHLQRLVSGSVVIDGQVRFEASRVGEETTTARVAKFIQESLSQRSKTQHLTDELADRRVYLTLGTGAAVYALTRDARRLQSVFLVDYSCALKLGTPVAFKAGMVRAAEQGVLVKGGEAIESLASVDTVVFDKTGTLTHSDLAVTDVVVLDGKRCEATLLALVASIEEHATHPIASAVVQAARDQALEHISHGEVSYLVAHGMSADVDGNRLYIGSRHYLEEHIGLDFSTFGEQIDQLQGQGKILLYVSDDQQPVGLIALRDRVREDARETIDRLRQLGIKRLILITGDRKNKARTLGRRLGLDEIHAEMPPEEKAAIVERLTREGARVAFVGDGVNDGPALAAAEVGIAMPRGADIARATADVVLMEDRLGLVADALSISKDTIRLIRTNFNLAVGINTAILGAAALGRVSPVGSALLHNGSTMGILLNALSGGKLTGGGKTPLPSEKS
ncbi:MAG: heavy metal translocating P-type ATPase [Wenzhouxiangella sp.]|nr:heavy metal translocating P-type ATPase [Wenzhouxiangella sp.]